MRFTAALLLALPAAACTTAGAGPASPRGPSIEVDGVARAYRSHVPASLDRARPVPVLLVFHGAGSDAADVERGSGFDALADAANAVVVYPEALSSVRRFDADPPAGRASADVRFVDALLERLRREFPVDGRRVFASGFSNGAAFCYRLAAERPGVVAAIAPVAAYLPALVRTPPVAPVPLLHVHGTRDDRVGAPSLAGTGGSAVETWARWNGCAGEPAATPAGDASPLVARRVAYAGATPRSDAALLLVEGAGHEWPGGPGGPVTRVVWGFLFAHPRE